MATTGTGHLTSGATVAITGVSGFLASELAAQLLARGVQVHGTVRSLDPARTEHLRALPGASTLLKLFEADLLTNTAGFVPAFSGCSVVFHTACPFQLSHKAEALGEEFFVEPAVKGTLAVLDAIRTAGSVTRVVLTSSTAAMLKRLVEPGYVYNESSWNDVEELATRKMWYSIAKTKQERAAWAWMDEQKPPFSLVSINPTMIAGGARQPTLNASLENIRDLFSDGPVKNINMPWVHLTDVAEAHIAAAERPEASGRYMMLAAWRPLVEAAKAVKACGLVGLTVSTVLADGETPAPLAAFDSSRVERELLGRPMRGLEDMMRDSVESLVKWGHVTPRTQVPA